MKRELWFRVENSDASEIKFDDVKVATIDALKKEIVKQYERLSYFADFPSPLDWHLYKSADAQEPEDSGDNLDVLEGAGKEGESPIILKRISEDSANQQFNHLQEEIKEPKELVAKFIEQASPAPYMKKLQRDSVITDPVALPTTSFIRDYPAFEWIENKKHAEGSKDACLDYICNLFSEFKLIEVQSAPNNLLDCDSGLPHHLKRATDFVAYPAESRLRKRNYLNILFDLEPNLSLEGANIAHTMGKVIVANTLSHNIGSLPSPIGVLTDLMDQWALIWISKNGRVCFASTMVNDDNFISQLDRNTAIYYIKKHLGLCNQLLEFKTSKKRSFDESELENINVAFGLYDSGYWRSRQDFTDTDRMEDFYDTMNEKEIEDHELKRTWRIVANSNIFPPYRGSPGS